jgi:hypothetical protein
LYTIPSVFVVVSMRYKMCFYTAMSGLMKPLS